MHERVEDKKRLQKYEHTELTLDDDQSDELSQVVQTISTNSPGPEVLSQIFEEAENQGKGQIVRDIRESDMRVQFNKDQARNGHYPITFLMLPPPALQFCLPPPSLSLSRTHTHTHTPSHTLSMKSSSPLPFLSFEVTCTCYDNYLLLQKLEKEATVGAL